MVAVTDLDDVTDSDGVTLRVADSVSDGVAVRVLVVEIVAVAVVVEDSDRDDVTEMVTLIVRVTDLLMLGVGDTDGVMDGVGVIDASSISHMNRSLTVLGMSFR